MIHHLLVGVSIQKVFSNVDIFNKLTLHYNKYNEHHTGT